MNKSTASAKENRINIWQLLPLLFVLAVNPLVIRYYGYNTNLAKLSWYGIDGQSSDFFNYYKSWFFVAAAVIMLLLLLYRQFITKEKMRWLPAFIPLGIYGLLALASGVFSKYSYFSVHGINDHFETVFVLLGYCIVVVYAANVIHSINDIKVLLGCWLAGIALLCLIGFSQLAGHDFFATELGKKMLLPSDMWDMADRLEFKMGPGRVYLTLFNPNYVGSYTVLAIPVLLAAVIGFKGIRWKACFAAGALGLLICLLGAGAKNGMVALAFALLVFIILMRKRMLKQWKLFGGGIALLAVCFIIFNAVKDNSLVQGIAAGFQIQKDQNSYPLERIETNDDNVAIVYNGHTMYIRTNMDEEGHMLYYLQDEKGERIDTQNTEDGSSLKILDDRFSGFIITSGLLEGKTPAFNVKIDGRDWTFSNATNYKGYFYLTPLGKFAKMDDAKETSFLIGYENLFSGRGYIWSRTLPLLKEHILLGSGPDTFSLVFPQRDYVKAARYGYYGMHITKPHNLYLQIGVQTGFLSLAAVLVFFLWYFVSSLRIYWKNSMEGVLSVIGAGICAGVFGYLISGIINDSTVTVAPVFWCILGIGFAVNRIVREERE